MTEQAVQAQQSALWRVLSLLPKTQFSAPMGCFPMLKLHCSKAQLLVLEWGRIQNGGAPPPPLFVLNFRSFALGRYTWAMGYVVMYGHRLMLTIEDKSGCKGCTSDLVQFACAARCFDSARSTLHYAALVVACGSNISNSSSPRANGVVSLYLRCPPPSLSGLCRRGWGLHETLRAHLCCSSTPPLFFAVHFFKKQLTC